MFEACLLQLIFSLPPEKPEASKDSSLSENHRPVRLQQALSKILKGPVLNIPQFNMASVNTIPQVINS
jgi:hypothetical protein